MDFLIRTSTVTQIDLGKYSSQFNNLRYLKE